MQVGNFAKGSDSIVIGQSKKAEGYSINSSGSAYKILSNTLYSDKTLAVVREVICNAIDAHIAKGCPEKPVEVTMTSDMFKVRDHGYGIAPEDMNAIYCQYFASTKEADDNQIGGFGLGAKAPYAISDIFYVTSHYKGTATNYVMQASSGSKGEPLMTPMSNYPTTESGLEVSVPVSRSLFLAFTKTLERFLVRNRVNVMMNGKSNQEENIFNKIGDIDKDGYVILEPNSSFATKESVLISSVVYPVDHNIISLKRPVIDFNVLVKAEPSKISILPSREGLSYDEPTIKYLKELFKTNADSINKKLTEDAGELVEVFFKNFFHHTLFKSFLIKQCNSNIERSARFFAPNDFKLPTHKILKRLFTEKGLENFDYPIDSIKTIIINFMSGLFENYSFQNNYGTFTEENSQFICEGKKVNVFGFRQTVKNGHSEIYTYDDARAALRKSVENGKEFSNTKASILSRITMANTGVIIFADHFETKLVDYMISKGVCSRRVLKRGKSIYKSNPVSGYSRAIYLSSAIRNSMVRARVLEKIETMKDKVVSGRVYMSGRYNAKEKIAGFPDFRQYFFDSKTKNVTVSMARSKIIISDRYSKINEIEESCRGTTIQLCLKAFMKKEDELVTYLNKVASKVSWLIYKPAVLSSIASEKEEVPLLILKDDTIEETRTRRSYDTIHVVRMNRLESPEYSAKPDFWINGRNNKGSVTLDFGTSGAVSIQRSVIKNKKVAVVTTSGHMEYVLKSGIPHISSGTISEIDDIAKRDGKRIAFSYLCDQIIHYSRNFGYGRSFEESLTPEAQNFFGRHSCWNNTKNIIRLAPKLVSKYLGVDMNDDFIPPITAKEIEESVTCIGSISIESDQAKLNLEDGDDCALILSEADMEKITKMRDFSSYLFTHSICDDTKKILKLAKDSKELKKFVKYTIPTALVNKWYLEGMSPEKNFNIFEAVIAAFNADNKASETAKPKRTRKAKVETAQTQGA